MGSGPRVPPYVPRAPTPRAPPPPAHEFRSCVERARGTARSTRKPSPELPSRRSPGGPPKQRKPRCEPSSHRSHAPATGTCPLSGTNRGCLMARADRQDRQASSHRQTRHSQVPLQPGTHCGEHSHSGARRARSRPCPHLGSGSHDANPSPSGSDPTAAKPAEARERTGATTRATPTRPCTTRSMRPSPST